LIEKGANINAMNKNNNTPLIVASKKGNLDIVKILIENEADKELKDKGDNTPLILASLNGHLDIVKFLVENGSLVNAVNKNNNTTLIFSTRNGYFEIVEFLIANGGDIENKDNRGNTSLIWASKNGYLDIVELLVEKGANIEVANENGSTPISLASQKGHSEIVEFLIKKENVQNVNNSLVIAAKNKQYNIVNEIISNILSSENITFTDSIINCSTEFAKNRIMNLYTYDKWNTNDRFVDFSDGYCYSFKEIRDMYKSKRKESIFTRQSFNSDDLNKMKIIGDLLIPIQEFEVKTDDDEDHAREGGYIKSRKTIKSRKNKTKNKTKKKSIRKNKTKKKSIIKNKNKTKNIIQFRL